MASQVGNNTFKVRKLDSEGFWLMLGICFLTYGDLGKAVDQARRQDEYPKLWLRAKKSKSAFNVQSIPAHSTKDENLPNAV